MNRGRVSTQVFLCFLMMMFLMVVVGCSNNDDTLPTYNISGAVTGATVAGVTINLTGAATATTTTDANGNFSFTGRANGTYTVTPVKADYTFNPVSSVAFVSGASVTNTNFVATANSASTYSISGTVAGAVLSGVTITLSGANTGSVATGVGGIYTISGLVPGSYTVTPSLTGFTFSPTNSAVTIAAANSTANNFVATAIPIAHSISGTVTALGLPLSGVTITVTGNATATATTNASGVFNVTGLYDGTYTLTPSKTGYTFSHTSSTATVSGADIAGKDFTATVIPGPTHSISGAVTLSGVGLSGVTINLGGDKTGSTITNTSGNYSLSGIVNGNYTVTPSLAGYTFSPANAAANVNGANFTVPNFVATAVSATYTQADLAGTWRMNMLETGKDGAGNPKNKWQRGIITLDSSGNATCVSMSDSTGVTTCPTPFDLKLTINSSGVISESGDSSSSTSHMTMTSNKNFIAGTGSGDGSQLRIIQKVVTGTSYSNAEFQNKSFVYHQLMVGADHQWSRADGTTDATGMLSLANDISPSGDHGAQPNVGRFSVDASGTVTIDTVSGFQGFLSADKKTIVGVTTESKSSSTYYSLMIIQVTGQIYTAGPLPAGISAAHMLAVGSTPAPFWLHFTSTVASGGVITASDWVASNPGITNPDTTNHGSISASGTVTIAEIPSFHGQVSHDGKFTVATQTVTSGAYALQVTTK